MRVINGNLTSGKQVWRFTWPCRQLHMRTEMLAQQSIEGQHLQGTAMLCPVHAPQGPSCRSEPSSLSHKNKTGIELGLPQGLQQGGDGAGGTSKGWLEGTGVQRSW